MPSINSLVTDIYELIGGNNGLSSSITSDLATNIAGAVQTSLGPQERRHLRLSGLGPKCPKALWHSIHTPELAEPLPPYARVKYTYGHIIEHLIIGLAKASGHEVTGEQDELSVDGVVGHRDCVIDGAIVDVKSSSSRGFQKFKDKSIAEADDFGYLDQLDGYILGSANDDLVRVKDRGYLLAIDKTLGHMVLYEHILRETAIRNRIRDYKDIVKLPSPPGCTCGTVPDGKSGNIRLNTTASYSVYKHLCFPKLRTFLYASGPVYLTKVVRTPDVTELTRTFH
jgi:hypothetical protein